MMSLRKLDGAQDEDDRIERSAESYKLEKVIRRNYLRNVTSFSAAYSDWEQLRRRTIRRLNALAEELHNEQQGHNETQLNLKEMGCLFSTVPKTNSAVDGLAKFLGVLSVAASGIASIAEACDIDSYQEKFKKIMLSDSEATKTFYKSMSFCANQCRHIQKMVKPFQSNTLESVVDTVTTALQTEKMAIAIAGRDDASKMMAAIGKFLNSALDIETMYTVATSVGNYVDENPAVLNACMSTARVAVGVCGMLGDKNEKRSCIEEGANYLMLRRDKREISRLNSVISQDLPQSKLEKRIRFSSYNLQSELDDVSEAYYFLTRWN